MSPSEKNKRLGRGLSALLGETETENYSAPDAGTTESDPRRGVNSLPIELIEPNPDQPRKTMTEAELDALAESIADKGIVQPLLVRPIDGGNRYQIVAGERRWRASQKAGLKTIPAVVRELDDLAVLEIGIIENVQRQDLNPIEEAEAYGQLMKRFGRTQEGLAESVGKSRVHIANTLRLLKLSEKSRDLVKSGQVSAGHARAALAAEDPDALLDRVVARGLSVRETEKLAREAAPIETKSLRSPDGDKDVDTKALETDLSRTLGLDVDIRHGARGGELRIKYKSLEQLDDLCGRLSRKKT